MIIVSSGLESTGMKFSPETDGEYLETEDSLHKPVTPAVLLEGVGKQSG